MGFANQIAKLTTENILQRSRMFTDNGDLDFSLPQRAGHFQADKDRPNHHRTLCIFRSLDDAAAVSQRAEITNMRQIGSRTFEPNRLGSRCEQERAVT